MGARERVRDAIQASADAAEKELLELEHADSYTRLSILIDGWARGFAAALEELAIAVDDLQMEGSAATDEEGAPPAVEPPAVESEAASEGRDLAEASENRLVEEARRSRAETAELREEGEKARRRLER